MFLPDREIHRQPEDMTVSETMRTIRYHEYGEPADVLRFEEAPVPTPKAGHVAVRVHACGLNPADWALTRGMSQFRGIWRHEPSSWMRTLIKTSTASHPVLQAGKVLTHKDVMNRRCIVFQPALSGFGPSVV